MMRRREFLTRTASRVGAAWLSSAIAEQVFASAPERFRAADSVVLGKTGIRTSRLACGTGTSGFGHRSNQSVLGVQALADLLWHGYDQGLSFWDTADAYGTHPHVGAALRRVPREKITILTKSWTRDGGGLRADLDRFRQELGTDYLDIVLLHCLTDPNWPANLTGAMEVLAEAREKGIIRAHGVSCHSIEALRAAARSPWVQVILARINPLGSHMDADPQTVAAVLREAKAAGKGIIGMKILAQGELGRRVDEALRFALSLDVLDAFTIGVESRPEQDDLVRRIATA